MKGKGIQPDLVTYNSLIQGLCNFGWWREATALLNEMTQRKIVPDVKTFSILVDTLCKEGMLTEAKEVFDVMVIVYNAKWMRWFLSSGLFHMMRARGQHPDVQTYAVLLDEITIARKIFYCLPTKGLQHDVWTYNIMIKELCKEGLIDEVSELLKKMDGHVCSPNECTYNTIIQGLLGHHEMSRAMKYLHIMVEKGFSANATTAATFFDLLSTNQADKNSQELLQKSR
ncbi:putative pentatricopeptide repeat-containing protein At1g12700, mitochondrial [Quercus suber]|uniref:putative pentatricopeptide repeat-containing protein At1g12700, mitochondrial n=1 Tax=Quercus suber TaxID=58331 RepID=UPI0032DFB4A7